MPRVIIENDRLRLALVPALGAGVAEFSMRGPDALFGLAPRTSFALVPTTNEWRLAALLAVATMLGLGFPASASVSSAEPFEPPSSPATTDHRPIRLG